MEDLILRVELYGKYSGRIDAREVVLEGRMVREAAQAIDYPSASADVFTRMICTAPDRIREVELEREQVADIAARAATSIVKQFAAEKDTKMGYKIRMTG